MEDEDIAALAACKPVAFNLADAAEGTIAVAQIATGDRIRVGIYIIKNEEDGLADILRFDKRAQDAAKAMEAREIEILALEITNNKLQDVLLRGGFSYATMPAPEELGGGTFEGLARVQPVL